MPHAPSGPGVGAGVGVGVGVGVRDTRRVVHRGIGSGELPHERAWVIGSGINLVTRAAGGRHLGLQPHVPGLQPFVSQATRADDVHGSTYPLTYSLTRKCQHLPPTY